MASNSRPGEPLADSYPPTSYVINHGTNVSINNGSTQGQTLSTHGVVITPLPPGVLISKVLVKTVNKKAKKKNIYLTQHQYIDDKDP